jgi:hypothetical protein
MQIDRYGRSLVAASMRSVLAFAAVVGCSPTSRPSMGTPDAPATHDVAAAVCFEPSLNGTVTHGTPNIQQCAIWNSVANMTGDVTLTRSADNLTMAFAAGVTYQGTVTGTQVHLVYSHLHDFTDGCKWRATESLDGTLDPQSCVMMLAYNYVEAVEISNGACATPCSGTADFSLQITPIF